MKKSHDRFYADLSGKRTVLIVDDEIINRELLGVIISSEYDVIYAENGQVALDILREKKRLISIVLLDLMMPVLSGFDVIRIMNEDPELHRIPIIVLTSEKDAEVKSLELGAYDFIPKPYDMPEVILARVRRNIELSEDNDILSNTERDELTGLLNRDFFYNYVENFDFHNPEAQMDAAIIDIDRFHVINELYGWTYGDKVLKLIGKRLMEVVQDTGSIIGRQDSDIFVIYAPHGTDFEAVLNSVIAEIEESISSHIHFRMGICSPTDRTIEVKRRFDRASQAADTIRNNYVRSVAYYNDSLREKELLSMQLVNEIDEALEQKQFRVYYQPKYNIRGPKPVLASAEALIRWEHPVRGMISPGIFIPVFEENGLILKLDRFIWRETLSQISRWRNAYGFVFPVSMNVSRIDISAPDFTQTIQNLVSEFGLEPSDCLLEVTESAYTENSDRIIEIIASLRSLGFKIEMDDFGSGYSSLNMLSHMPIDALKLDMEFIRGMGTNSKNDRMLKLMIEIAEFLSVPVIAEGVETEKQVLALKEMGCDLIQGYYFSPPVPPQEFEKFIEKEIKKDDDC